MKDKQRIILSDFFRAFTSVNFWVALIGVTVLCTFNSLEFMILKDNNMDIVYIFNTMIAIGSFKNMIILIGAVPFAMSFCSDWKQRYIRSIIIRSSVEKYIWSKIINTALTSFLAVFLGMTLYICVLLVNYPLIIKGGFLSDAIAETKPYGELLLSSDPILFFLSSILLISLASAFWSVVGITISGYVPNHFVAGTAPFVASNIIGGLTEMLPIWLNLRCLSYSYDVIGKGPKMTLLYTATVFIILIIISGIFFHRIVKRRIADEII